VAAASILVVDDEKITGYFVRDLLRTAGYKVELASNGEEALERLQDQRFDAILTDLIMPGIDGLALIKRVKLKYPTLPILVLSAQGGYDLARKAQLAGAEEFLRKPVNPEQLNTALEAVLGHTQKALLKTLTPAPAAPRLSQGLVGSSAPMLEVQRLIERARQNRASVLVRGESGTGKELVARAIYQGESRQGHFVVVNCAAISEGLIESELFGHARGAFSGAVVDREGLFEAADGGTLFLDEIGDIPPKLQTKLLRALQEGEFRRVGENRLRHASVRVIAATNRDLERAIETGLFREDLYYRLNVIPINLPPLRERIDDIPRLVRHFMQKHQRGALPPLHLADGAIERLQQYDFPGNVRELENIVVRALSLTPGPIIEAIDLEAFLKQVAGNPRQGLDLAALQELDYPGFKSHLRQQEKDYILARLREMRWNVSDAARSMGMTRTALHNRLKKLGVQSKEMKRLERESLT
jgi:DNA-binding NtrC family response regulator